MLRPEATPASGRSTTCVAGRRGEPREHRDAVAGTHERLDEPVVAHPLAYVDARPGCLLDRQPHGVERVAQRHPDPRPRRRPRAPSPGRARRAGGRQPSRCRAARGRGGGPPGPRCAGVRGARCGRSRCRGRAPARRRPPRRCRGRCTPPRSARRRSSRSTPAAGTSRRSAAPRRETVPVAVPWNSCHRASAAASATATSRAASASTRPASVSRSPAAAGLDQGGAERPLGAAQLLRHRRRGAVGGGGDRGDGAAVVQLAQQLEVPDIHAVRLQSLCTSFHLSFIVAGDEAGCSAHPSPSPRRPRRRLLGAELPGDRRVLQHFPPFFLVALRFALIAVRRCCSCRCPTSPCGGWSATASGFGTFQFLFLYWGMAAGMPAGLSLAGAAGVGAVHRASWRACSCASPARPARRGRGAGRGGRARRRRLAAPRRSGGVRAVRARAGRGALPGRSATSAPRRPGHRSRSTSRCGCRSCRRCRCWRCPSSSRDRGGSPTR